MLQITNTAINKTMTITPKHFPDGTQMLLEFNPWFLIANPGTIINITWKYETDEELLTLIYVKRHIDNNKAGVKPEINLYMPYIPNARMDRIKHDSEIFTLKYFCEVINSLNFDKVYVLDAHSNVSVGLLNNCVNQSPEEAISYAMRCASRLSDMDTVKCIDAGLVIYFPDEGAYKRYSGYNIFEGHEIIVGRKNRDWKTGKILGLEVCDRNGKELGKDFLHGLTVLMVDDIISYGGTMAYSAEKLKELGAGKIYAYATHVENSILDEEKGTLLKAYREGIISGVITTNSLYSGPIGNMVSIAENLIRLGNGGNDK